LVTPKYPPHPKIKPIRIAENNLYCLGIKDIRIKNIRAIIHKIPILEEHKMIPPTITIVAPDFIILSLQLFPGKPSHKHPNAKFKYNEKYEGWMIEENWI
jgi:hypothetical protein